MSIQEKDIKIKLCNELQKIALVIRKIITGVIINTKKEKSKRKLFSKE